MELRSNSKRIAKNTVMLYFRQILIMFVSLYTVRVVLNVLGAEDYGIYNVVAGVVTLFGFLSNAMATASQRYFSIDIGKNNEEHLKTTFSVTFQIYLVLAIIITLVAETIGLWFVNYKLIIPKDRMIAANWIFQAAVISFLLSLITAPYMACIISHENMNVYAYVGIIEGVLKLGIVFILKVLPYDKLIVYGGLLTLVSLINTSLYRIYCHKHYKECHFYFIRDKDLFIEIIKYNSWNLFASVSGIIRKQGITILLNLFFGPVVNAARAVASQVSGAVMSFAQNFSSALRPHIIKLYASGKKDEMLRMLIYGTKIIFFLMFIMCIPLYFEAPFLMKFWLKNVPEHTVMFVRLVLIHVLIDSISYPLIATVHATGKIKVYQIVVGGCCILNLPISYVFLRIGFNAEFVFVVEIFLSIISFFLRIIIAKRICNINILSSFLRLILLFLILIAISSALAKIIIDIFGDSFFDFATFVLLSILWNLLLIFFIGLKKEERLYILKNWLRKNIQE